MKSEDNLFDNNELRVSRLEIINLMERFRVWRKKNGRKRRERNVVGSVLGE